MLGVTPERATGGAPLDRRINEGREGIQGRYAKACYGMTALAFSSSSGPKPEFG